jgi:hypothetical protein
MKPQPKFHMSRLYVFMQVENRPKPSVDELQKESHISGSTSTTLTEGQLCPSSITFHDSGRRPLHRRILVEENRIPP